MFPPYLEEPSYFKRLLIEADKSITLGKHEKAAEFLHDVLWWLPSDISDENGLHEIFIKLHDSNPGDLEKKQIEQYYHKILKVATKYGYTISGIVEAFIEKEWL
jgi:hypothetical protein